MSVYFCYYPEKKIKKFGMCRKKPKCYGKQSPFASWGVHKRSNGNHWTLFRQTKPEAACHCSHVVCGNHDRALYF